MRALALACGCVVLAFLCVFEAGTDYGNNIIGPFWGLLGLLLFLAAFGLVVCVLVSAVLRTVKELRKVR